MLSYFTATLAILLLGDSIVQRDSLDRIWAKIHKFSYTQYSGQKTSDMLI